MYGYDWNIKSDNFDLISKEVMAVLGILEKAYPLEFSFDRLRGKDGNIYCDICHQIQSANVVLFDVSTHNPNVVLELGLAIGTGKYVFILRSKHHKRPPSSLSDLMGTLEYRFSRKSGNLKFQANFRRSLMAKLLYIAKEYSRRSVSGPNKR
jgi:nucleoside 2-deoxyribosyltransferase